MAVSTTMTCISTSSSKSPCISPSSVAKSTTTAPPSAAAAVTATPLSVTRRRRSIVICLPVISVAALSWPKPSSSSVSDFSEIPNSGGVMAFDLRLGDGSKFPVTADQVSIHYYGRLAAKQGWRFDSTYDHKDEAGEPIPFKFILGSGKVITGIETAVRSMSVGGIRRVVIPPSQGYQNTSQEPIPPNFFDRQRLFTTIFNPTRLANGEGSTLGTLIFDIELMTKEIIQGFKCGKFKAMLLQLASQSSC